jgi:hypothetical protein
MDVTKKFNPLEYVGKMKIVLTKEKPIKQTDKGLAFNLVRVDYQGYNDIIIAGGKAHWKRKGNDILNKGLLLFATCKEPGYNVNLESILILDSNDKPLSIMPLNNIFSISYGIQPKIDPENIIIKL